MKFVLISTIFAIIIFTLFSSTALAVTYPVAELDNCATEEECKTYCDDISHIDVCLNFAETNDLMTSEEI